MFGFNTSLFAKNAPDTTYSLGILYNHLQRCLKRTTNDGFRTFNVILLLSCQEYLKHAHFSRYWLAANAVVMRTV